MATLTPNLGLTLPAGDENVSRQVINDNMMIIDAAAGNNSSLDAMQEGLTNIVDGDTTDEAIPAGAYAYLKNNTHGLAEGYYQNISGSAFPTSGGTASITTFAPVSTAGILNSLNNNFGNLFALLTGCGEPNTIHDTGISCGISGYGTIKVYTYVGTLQAMTKDTDYTLFSTSAVVRPLVMLGTIKANSGNVEFPNGTFVSFAYNHNNKTVTAKQQISSVAGSFFIRFTFVYVDLI